MKIKGQIYFSKTKLKNKTGVYLTPFEEVGTSDSIHLCLCRSLSLSSPSFSFVSLSSQILILVISFASASKASCAPFCGAEGSDLSEILCEIPHIHIYLLPLEFLVTMLQPLHLDLQKLHTRI
jgi:hypothetical protein